MHVKKVLFATDFSSIANQALDYAATLAKESGAKLLIVHVAELPRPTVPVRCIMGSPSQIRMSYCECCTTSSRNPPADHEYRLLKGDPGARS